MGVSENSGTTKSSIFNRVFHYKPSILGYPYFWFNTHIIMIRPPLSTHCAFFTTSSCIFFWYRGTVVASYWRIDHRAKPWTNRSMYPPNTCPSETSRAKSWHMPKVSWKRRGRGWQWQGMMNKEHWRFLGFSRQEILQGGQKSEQKQCRVFRHVSKGRLVEGSRLVQFLKFRLTILHVILVSWFSCPGRGMFIPMKLHFVQITILPKP